MGTCATQSYRDTHPHITVMDITATNDELKMWLDRLECPNASKYVMKYSSTTGLIMYQWSYASLIAEFGVEEGSRIFYKALGSGQVVYSGLYSPPYSCPAAIYSVKKAEREAREKK
jgi:hypothetical protein